MNCGVDMAGSLFCADPLEGHEFVEGTDDYYCRTCHKPRALHRGKETGTIPSNVDPRLHPIRSQSFNLALRGPLLTDARIEHYQKLGYYTEAYREARRQHWQRRESRSNFRSLEGRLIYCPS